MKLLRALISGCRCDLLCVWEYFVEGMKEIFNEREERPLNNRLVAPFIVEAACNALDYPEQGE